MPIRTSVQRSQRYRRLAAGLSVLGFVLWSTWVWYAKYLHCDDLLREQGGLELRLADGELGGCTLPDAEVAVYEVLWAIGLAGFLLIVGALFWSGRSSGGSEATDAEVERLLADTVASDEQRVVAQRPG